MNRRGCECQILKMGRAPAEGLVEIKDLFIAHCDRHAIEEAFTDKFEAAFPAPAFMVPKTILAKDVHLLPTRKLDRAVAEKIFGIDPSKRETDAFKATAKRPFLSCYSTDLGAAFRVLEKMREKEFAINIHSVPSNQWYVWIRSWTAIPTKKGEMTNESLSRAICEAALRAVEGQDADDSPIGKDGTR